METKEKHRRLGRKRALPITISTILGLVVLLVTALFVGQSMLLNQVNTLPDAMPTSKDRPAATEGNAKTILLLGSDKRADGSVKGERSDTMMVVRVAADRKSVSVVSLPRDSWVPIPGHGKSKINAAFAFGGTPLAVETVEDLSGVRIDHVAVIDWEGFKRLTDMFGGVTVTIPEKTYDAYRKKTWEKGTHHLDGAETLLYVRQRAGLPNGDLDRVKRQQNVMRILISETLSKQTLSNPIKVYKVLDAITENLEVDDGLTGGQMRSLAYSLRSLRAKDVRFTTIPVAGLGMEGAQSVVYVDFAKADKMWKAFRKDQVAEWIDKEKRGLEASVK